MDISAIYGILKRGGYCASQIDFSTNWLGRSPRYYSHLIASRQEPGLGTLLALEWRLSNRLKDQPEVRQFLRDLRSHITTRSIVDQSIRGKRLERVKVTVGSAF